MQNKIISAGVTTLGLFAQGVKATANNETVKTVATRATSDSTIGGVAFGIVGGFLLLTGVAYLYRNKLRTCCTGGSSCSRCCTNDSDLENQGLNADNPGGTPTGVELTSQTSSYQ